MRTAIWGAGYIGGKQLIAVGRDKVDFFIDSSPQKCGKLFCEKWVIHPDELSTWSDLFVYVPYNFYNEIKVSLVAHGLVEDVDFCKYDGKNGIDEQILKKDLKRALQELEENKERLKNNVIFWGWNFFQKSNYKSFFMRMRQTGFTPEICVVGENVWVKREQAEKENEVATIIAPLNCDRDIYLINSQLSNRDLRIIEETEKLADAAKAAMGTYGISRRDAFSEIYYLLYYAEKVISEVKPALLIIDASRVIRSYVLEYVCKRQGVKHLYSHPGHFPGTYIFDPLGESGCCVPNINAEKFSRLPVDSSDISKACEIWEYLYESKANRKCQPNIDLVEMLEKKVNKHRPTILFAAHVDSDNIPYTEHVRKHFSPMFATSIDAGVHLSYICRKNNWNFIYKPHPLSVDERIHNLLADGSIYLEQANINDLIDASDVVVTVQSSVNYVALIRSKPVVMLRYNVINGKGCTYEVYVKENIERILECAIEKGFTQKQKEAFRRHIAQNIKYYLYDDLSERDIRYGKDVPRCIDDFFALERHMMNAVVGRE